MDRRKFIINTSLCAGALCFGCGCSKDNNILPDKITLESCTLCQLNCPECWRNTNPERMPLGYLKFEDFKKFVDKNPHIKKIDLSSYGEIFLNPDLNEIIKYGYQKNIFFCAQAGVNLNTLSDETAELLVLKKFNFVTVSIDGASQETYSVYRRGGDFNKVIENIKKIQFYQKKYNDFEHPKLVWKFIPFGHNEHEIPKAKQIAKELGIPITFCANYSSNYSPIKDIDFVRKETNLELENFEERNIINSNEYKNYDEFYYNSILQLYKQKFYDWFFCTAFINNPIIFYDGKFLGCCMNHYNKAPNINAFKQSLESIYKRKDVLDIINTFQFKNETHNTICKNCDVYKFLKKHKYTLNV